MIKFTICFEREKKDLSDVLKELRKLNCQNIGVDWESTDEEVR